MADFSELPVEIVQKIIKEVPVTHLRTLSNFSLTCKSIYNYVIPHLYKTLYIRLEGYTGAGSHAQTFHNLSTWQNSYQPSHYIKEIVVDGYWISKDEVDSDDYRLTSTLSIEHFEDISGVFDKSLAQLMRSLPDLESFRWLIIHPIPLPVLEELSRFSNFKSFISYCDTHIISTIEGEREFVVGLDPTALEACSLETLHILELSDLHQCIQFGDVIRSPTTWGKLRNLKVTLSTWYSCKQVDIEPHDHDLLSFLFRPYPANRKEKLKLTNLALSDIQCHARGTRALTSCIDPSTLEDLYFYFIHDASDIFRAWSPAIANLDEMKMLSLKRLYIREEREFPYLESFMSQFVDPRRKGGQGLEWLELHSWHIEVPFGGGLVWGGFHPNQGVNIPFNIFGALAGERKTVGNLQTVDESTSWGLKKLYLDLRRNGPFGGPKIVDNIRDFLSPFWRLEMLAMPISYERDMWSAFVQAVSALPELRFLYLLNFRNEKETAGGLYRIPLRSVNCQPPQRAPRHWSVAAKDALQIAEGNRLYSHTAQDFPEGKSSNYSLGLDWRGKLEYIGIRNIKPDAEREILIWKVVLRHEKMRKGKTKHEVNEHGEWVELLKLHPTEVVGTTMYCDR